MDQDNRWLNPRTAEPVPLASNARPDEAERLEVPADDDHAVHDAHQSSTMPTMPATSG